MKFKFIKIWIFVFALTLSSTRINAQSILFNSIINESNNNINACLNVSVQLQNAFLDKDILLTIDCYDSKNSTKVFSYSTEFKMKSNILQLSSNNFKLLYSNNSYVDNGQLKNGEYRICGTAKLVYGNELIIDDCEYFFNIFYLPPNIITPFKNETVSTLYPNLIWTPITPALNSQLFSYRLSVYELLTNQSELEALTNNIPIYQTKVITNSLTYPISAMPLRYSKNYIWNVEGYVKNESVGKSEIGSFTIKYDSLPISQEQLNKLSFSRLTSINNNNIYSVTNFIPIQIENFNIDEGEITIEDINGKVLYTIEEDEIKMYPDNKIIILLNDIQLSKNKSYLIKYSLKPEPSKYIYFKVVN
jgi:hypothetical protein